MRLAEWRYVGWGHVGVLIRNEQYRMINIWRACWENMVVINTYDFLYDQVQKDYRKCG